MSDIEIIDAYNNAYNEEFKHYVDITSEVYVLAKDKKYAIEYGLSALKLGIVFRNGSETEKIVEETYNHIIKLGGSISDVVREISQIIEEQKIKRNELRLKKPNKTSIVYKKFLGIPYAIQSINVTSETSLVSPFENLSSLFEISIELAKQRAIIDVHNQLENKLNNFSTESLNLGGKLLPSEFEALLDLKLALNTNNLDVFFRIFQSIFASLPYNMKITEGYFHSHIHILLKLLGFKIESEIETNIGRIDSVVETENFIHIMEFKTKNSGIAIKQIIDKMYYQKYLITNKSIVIVGISLDNESRNISKWEFQKLDRNNL